MESISSVIYVNPYGPIAVLIYVIILTINIALLIRYPSIKTKIGYILVIAGVFEIVASMAMQFQWTFVIGLATIVCGIVLPTAWTRQAS